VKRVSHNCDKKKYVSVRTNKKAGKRGKNAFRPGLYKEFNARAI
jgi:hypothetical protein